VAWVKEAGPSLFGADPARVVAAGSSAGGHLALSIGFKAQPVAGIVSFYGYGDLVGPWYSSPSPHPRHALPSERGGVEHTEEQSWAEVSGHPIANSADRQVRTKKRTKRRTHILKNSATFARELP
jgi:acetyl esterase/lipase